MVKGLPGVFDDREESRLRALEEFGLFDTPPEEDFDCIAALASRVSRCPVALIGLMGRDRLYFKARHGTKLYETPRDTAFCSHVLTGQGPLVVLDTIKDARFAANPLVTGPPAIRFYAGVPLVANSGFMIGTLCVVDSVPRARVDDDEQRTLQDLARLAMQQMEIRRLRRIGDEALRARAESERQFEILVGGVKDYALYRLTPDGIVASWNSGAETIKGYTAAEIIGRHYSRFYTEEDRASAAPGRALQIAAADGRFEADGWRVRRDGSLFWANVVIDAIRDEVGQLTGFAKITRDITHRRNNEEHLRRQALTDGLTGLSNRNAFLYELANVVHRQPAALLLLDLDGFKEINDTLGHQAGDALLKAVGVRLQEAAGGASSVARIGGDEFAVVFPGMADPLSAAARAESIIDAFRRSFVCDETDMQVGLSVGIAIAPHHGQTANELLANADFALYDVKSQRRTGYSLFQEAFRQTALARRTCKSELKRAVAQGELELHYQPQLRLDDRRIVGAEALLRWKSSRARADSAGSIHPCPGAQPAGRTGGAMDRASGLRVRSHDPS